MAEVPQGYRQVSEEDAKRAKVFFDRAQTVASTGNYEYAIEMFLQGLNIDPDSTDAHPALREISLKRKASGGKDLGMFEKMKLKRPTKDDAQNMLSAEKMLAYDPGNTDHMVSILQNGHRAGCFDTCIWIADILMKANADGKSPEFNKFIVLKDVMVALGQWKKATDACHYAALLRPNDMDLQTELKNLGAQHTMSKGNYGTAKSFRDSVRDMSKQQGLMNMDKDVRTDEQMHKLIKEAETDWNAEPNDAGKFRKLIEILEKTELPEYENRAVALLEQMYGQTRQFNFRHRVGQIQMKQLTREERTRREAFRQNPNDEATRKSFAEFMRSRNEFELGEFQLWSENYPTEMRWRYETGLRLFRLERYDEAIPLLQEAVRDPKLKADANIILAQSFLAAGYVDEAAETLERLINEYAVKGDLRSKEMHYWRARALELKNQGEPARKLYSQIAQWDFNYRDVQKRLKELRSPAPSE